MRQRHDRAAAVAEADAQIRIVARGTPARISEIAVSAVSSGNAANGTRSGKRLQSIGADRMQRVHEQREIEPLRFGVELVEARVAQARRR